MTCCPWSVGTYPLSGGHTVLRTLVSMSWVSKYTVVVVSALVPPTPRDQSKAVCTVVELLVSTGVQLTML